ncbi:hypothetical protein Leryth_012414 [Lithospermum erythrorhizon]|nr:hypothetical protein Leryth_012414 [Lithospermum erythrorhizon]
MEEASSEAVVSSRVKVNGVEVTATLSPGGRLNFPGWSLAIDKEILSFTTQASKIIIKALIEKGAGITCGVSSQGHVRKTFVFDHVTKEAHEIWTRRLHHFIVSLGRPKRLFVFVNPFGGRKSATKIFEQDVKPLLEDANIEITVQETAHQLHAKEVVRTLDLSKYDGIVCVSGDGVLVEVVNGLLEREDWATAIRTPLGLVPAGTGNGMVKSLLDSVGEPCSASYATLAIIQGHKTSLDVATLRQGETIYFSVLMLAWGLVADIDIESEKYRWMGSSRFDFYALQRIFSLRKYTGRILFVPAPGYEPYGEPVDLGDQFLGEADSTQKLNEGSLKGQPSHYQGPIVDPKDLNWRKLEGPFISVWLHNVPWGSEDTKAAPDAKFSDGCLDLILMKDCSRLALLSLMTELNNGGHVKSPHVIYIKVKAFILEPGPRSDNSAKEGIIDVDGEVLASGKGTYKSNQKTLMAYNKLQITIDQGLATLFTPV